MLCKKCGTNNPSIARFCEHCGTKLVKGKYVSTEKKSSEGNDVPASLVAAVIIVILVVAAIFVTLSLV